MRVVIQRVAQSVVRVAEEPVARIAGGLLVLPGIAEGDATPHADFLADKLVNLRIFGDKDRKMNLSLREMCKQAALAP